MSRTYGSQHELLQWVHVHTDELNARVLAASDSLSRFATRIDWIGPSAAGAELRDSAWDEAGLAPPSPHASGW